MKPTAQQERDLYMVSLIHRLRDALVAEEGDDYWVDVLAEADKFLAAPELDGDLPTMSVAIRKAEAYDRVLEIVGEHFGNDADAVKGFDHIAAFCMANPPIPPTAEIDRRPEGGGGR